MAIQREQMARRDPFSLSFFLAGDRRNLLRILFPTPILLSWMAAFWLLVQAQGTALLMLAGISGLALVVVGVALSLFLVKRLIK